MPPGPYRWGHVIFCTINFAHVTATVGTLMASAGADADGGSPADGGITRMGIRSKSETGLSHDNVEGAAFVHNLHHDDWMGSKTIGADPRQRAWPAAWLC